jgi:hypothetical protein
VGVEDAGLHAGVWGAAVGAAVNWDDDEDIDDAWDTAPWWAKAVLTACAIGLVLIIGYVIGMVGR